MAYLSADQRDELQLLEQEKSRQILARSSARETNSFIAQEERRLAAVANINLQQAELDRQKAALQRPKHVPRQQIAALASSLTPHIPLLKIAQPIIMPITEGLTTPPNGETMSEKTAALIEECFGPPDPKCNTLMPMSDTTVNKA